MDDTEQRHQAHAGHQAGNGRLPVPAEAQSDNHHDQQQRSDDRKDLPSGLPEVVESKAEISRGFSTVTMTRQRDRHDQNQTDQEVAFERILPEPDVGKDEGGHRQQLEPGSAGVDLTHGRS